MLEKSAQNEWKTKDKNEIYFAQEDQDVQKGKKAIDLLLLSDPTNSKSLLLKAMFLLKSRDFRRAEECFLKSIESNPANSFCLLEYRSFLLSCGMESAANFIYRIIDEFSFHKIFSPFSGLELGGVIKVFEGDGSFKSLSITATTPASDVLVMVCHASKTFYSNRQCVLVALDSQIPLYKVCCFFFFFFILFFLFSFFFFLFSFSFFFFFGKQSSFSFSLSLSLSLKNFLFLFRL